MEAIWKTEPTVHYLNVSHARTWTTVKFQTNQAAHDYYKLLVQQYRMPAAQVKLVYGTVAYHDLA